MLTYLLLLIFFIIIVRHGLVLYAELWKHFSGRSNKESDIKITRRAAEKKKPRHEEGEYIDYEEVK